MAIPLLALGAGITMTLRLSLKNRARLSPTGLLITLFSAGCLLFGQIMAHAFPIGFDSSDQHPGVLSGFVTLDTPSTLLMGLAYGGMLLLGIAPFLLLFVAIIRFSQNKKA